LTPHPGCLPFVLARSADERVELRLDGLSVEQALEAVLEALMADTQRPRRVHGVEGAAPPEHRQGLFEVLLGNLEEPLDVDGVPELGVRPDLGEDLGGFLGSPAGRRVVLEPDLGPCQAEVGSAARNRGVLEIAVVDDVLELLRRLLVDAGRVHVHRGGRLDDPGLALAEEVDIDEPLGDDVGAQDATLLEVLDGDGQQAVGVAVDRVRIL